MSNFSSTPKTLFCLVENTAIILTLFHYHKEQISRLGLPHLKYLLKLNA